MKEKSRQKGEMFYFAGLNMQFDAKLLNMQFDAKLLNHHKLFNLNQTVENYIKTAILYTRVGSI